MQLHFKEYGAGPPLVILHGLLGAGGNWHTLGSKAFGPRFRVLAVDLRNHGRSPHSPVHDYPAMVADLEEFVDAHGLGRVHLLGHSMGGKVAMHFALEHPERVDRLVVSDMAPKRYPPHHTDLLEALHALDPGAYRSRQEIDDALAARVPEAPVRQFLLKNLAYEAGRYGWQANLEGLYRSAGLLSAEVPPGRTFGGPVLFVRGERSGYIEDGDMPLIRTLFPRAELATVPGAGHWIHADRPQEFARLVLAFLEDDQEDRSAGTPAR